MEMPRFDKDFAKSVPARPETVTAKAVERTMLRWAIDNRIPGQITLIIPLSIIAIAANGTAVKNLFWFLLALQIIAQLFVAASSKYVQYVLKNNLPAARAVSFWTFCEAAPGFLWGLMLLPTTSTLSSNMASLTICMTLVVTVTASCLMASPASRLVHAILLGFAVTMFIQLIYFQDIYGLYPSLAIVGLIVGLFWVVSALKQHAHNSKRSHMENTLLNAKLEDALEVAEYLSRHDSLTGLLNRRDFERTAAELSTQLVVQDNNHDMAIILIDIDHFKTINDSHGHAVGDEVLVQLGSLLKRYIRTERDNDRLNDAIARWGGEEFILLLTQCSSDNAIMVADRIRAAIEEYDDPQWPNQLNITASLGTAAWSYSESLHDAIGRADKAMYAAKAAGRNRVHSLTELN